QEIPYLGLCLGMQVMVVEMAREAFGDDSANSTEFDPNTPYPVISLLEEQQGVNQMGGTMRLGAYPCCLVAGTKAREAYGTDEVMERHRHRYEFNMAFREPLMLAGLVASGLSPDGTLVEISEIAGHPFMVGTQFHPEFRSRPDRPHPLFRDFMKAAKERASMAGEALVATSASETSEH
ncbi:MAG: gamma-glutamyl-gamma-aminobutyrate hydrolase family protein, partial [Dehalococcoidia bacterium]|nr:gamma-glutamyl-gamma-aminobutyrate hydrolase family protein [Dehalococcoidia bacterium]